MALTEYMQVEMEPSRRMDWVPLRTFVVLRWIAISGQVAALFVATQVFGLEIDMGPAIAIVGLPILANVVAIFVYPESRRMTANEMANHLAFDVVQLTALLYLAGGIHNPFAVLMLVPVTVCATVLPRSATAIISGMAIAGITLVTFIHQPLMRGGETMEMPVDFVAGSWTAISIGVIFVATYVQRVTAEVTAMAEALAETQMALAREQKLTDIGGLIAAAAHELGTPLATIKLAANELREDLADRPEAVEDLVLIGQQADRCRDILHRMGRADEIDPHLSRLQLEVLVREAAGPHAERGPEIVWTAAPGPGAAPRQPVVARRPGILHGLRNIVQNAVDFAETTVWIDMHWDEESILVRIVDDGPGFPSDIVGRIGDPFLTTRAEGEGGYAGMGLGLFIAKTLLERSGAQVTFANGRDRGVFAHDAAGPRRGAIVEVTWPREALLP